jgi:hypothetical protein
MCGSVESGYFACHHAALPPFRYRTGRRVQRTHLRHRHAGKDAILGRQNDLARNGIFGSACAKRERMANQAPGMCSFR